jgi:tRNA threonylcarbamoyladenosine biosynthesis protein TsaB
VNLLALETSTIACSVALARGDRVFERHVVKPKEHTRLLIPMIKGVLADGGIAPSGLQAIVLGNGPGSFIGIRIAASVAQGLAYAADLKIVPVSSLAAVAAEAFDQTAAQKVVVAQDAHMNEVYVAGFVKGQQGIPITRKDALLHPIGRIDWLANGDAPRWHAAGAGWQRYPELLQRNSDRLAGSVDALFPHARYLLAAGRAAWQAGAATDPGKLVPDYVRSRVASVPEARRS